MELLIGGTEDKLLLFVIIAVIGVRFAFDAQGFLFIARPGRSQMLVIVILILLHSIGRLKLIVVLEEKSSTEVGQGLANAFREKAVVVAPE